MYYIVHIVYCYVYTLTDQSQDLTAILNWIPEVNEDLFACEDHCLVYGFLLSRDKQAWIYDCRNIL